MTQIQESLNGGLKIATEQERPVWTKALEDWRAYKAVSEQARGWRWKIAMPRPRRSR
jgi:methyl-accepting chemotaxis protein